MHSKSKFSILFTQIMAFIFGNHRSKSVLWPKLTIYSLYFFVWYNHCLLCLHQKHIRKKVKQKQTHKPKLCYPSSLSFLIYEFSLKNKKNSFKKVLVTVWDAHPRGRLCQAKGRFCNLGLLFTWILWLQMLPLQFQVLFGDVSTEALGYRLLPFLLSWAAFWSLKNKVKYTHWRKNITIPVGTRLFGHRKRIFPAVFIITADLIEHTNKGSFAAQGKKC